MIDVSGLWGQDKPEQKRAGGHGTGWLRSPQSYKIVRITSAEVSLHAKWVDVTDADVINGRPLIRHTRRTLRFNAEQLWVNLVRQGWKRVPPQWQGSRTSAFPLMQELIYCKPEILRTS